VSHTFSHIRVWVLISCTDGHYLNLPVVEDDGRLVAIVDVLKLTYATLEQVSHDLLSLSLGSPLPRR
jgi:hypothetical protein